MEHLCETETMAYIVMEYVAGGELFSRIVSPANKGCGLGESITKFYAWQLFGALEYLHKNGIVHRDIKAENVLLLENEDYTVVKLTDFGLSKITNGQSMRTFCGTKCYMAPEQWKAEAYSCKVDIWALGAVIFICMCGRLVFYKGWEKVSPFGRKILRQCFRTEPEHRISATEALASEWFKDPIVEKARSVVQNHTVRFFCF
ncbi:unnamed protein product [Gongylonema pulchrum]|uniref:Protein kinase domain-containing protein n=1 Tax=Gongylonema pulchrum TaxID=637853 RepID=A0A183E545_9BILA|nr:unnamed protein product [Gongylonema pulchrum]